MRFLTISASAIAMIAAAQAPAQEPTPSANSPISDLADERADDLANGLLTSVASGPTDRALTHLPFPEIQLVASADEKVASLAWSYSLSNPTQNRLNFTQLTARLATSIEGDGETELFGLRGFPGGTEVSLALTRFFGGMREPTGAGRDREEEIIQTAIARCRADPRLTDAQEAQTCDENHADFPGISAIVERYNLRGLDVLTRGRFAPLAWFLGIEFSGNQDSFKFLDRTAFAIDSRSRFGYGATLFGGTLFTNSLTSITGSFTYSRRYEAQRSVTICQMINQLQEQCLTGADGPPTTNRRAIAAVELRHAFGSIDSGPARFAIAPEFSVDLRNKAYSVDVPIYFAADNSGQLRGGVRLGYVNSRADGGGREDDFSIGLFVGVPFRLGR